MARKAKRKSCKSYAKNSAARKNCFAMKKRRKMKALYRKWVASGKRGTWQNFVKNNY